MHWMQAAYPGSATNAQKSTVQYLWTRRLNSFDSSSSVRLTTVEHQNSGHLRWCWAVCANFQWEPSGSRCFWLQAARVYKHHFASRWASVRHTAMHMFQVNAPCKQYIWHQQEQCRLSALPCSWHASNCLGTCCATNRKASHWQVVHDDVNSDLSSPA